MDKFIKLDQLTPSQLNQYKDAVRKAFPPIIGESQVIKTYWERLEIYFPQFQLFLTTKEGDLIGFINTIPFQFSDDLNELPEGGWDWMLRKGITDFETKLSPNYLGGLQVIIRKKYQNLGYSKKVINYTKHILQSSNLLSLVIPIRPTKKHLFQKMPMTEYMNLKEENKVYDPWIRTHLKSGAQIIKVCEKSMSIKGDIPFWEKMLDRKITASGDYLLTGALSPIRMDINNNIGEYIEPNIWIKYN